MIYESIVQQRGGVSFPEFSGERVYMREFRKHFGLPTCLSRWSKTVEAMLDGVEADGPIYLMIDQAFVRRGALHRRGGVHIDGYWHPGVKAHGGHYPYAPPQHGPAPIPTHVMGSAGKHGWKHGEFSQPEAIILAASHTASWAYRGEWEGEVGEGGDCDHIDVSQLEPVRLDSGFTYAGSVACLHKTTPLLHDCYRTLVRLNVPGWTPTP